MAGPWQQRMFPGGLRAQLLLGLSVVMLGALSLVHLAFVQVTRVQMQRALVEDARGLGEQALQACVETLPYGPGLLGREVVSTMRARAQASFLGLVCHGQTATSGTSHVARQWQEAWRLAPGAGGEGWQMQTHGGAQYLWWVRRSPGPGVSKPADALQEPEAMWVAVVLPWEPMQARLDEISRQVWLFSLLGLVVTCMLGYGILTYLVMRPVRALALATERATEGNLASAVQLQPPNEFGQLARQFNTMLARLQIQHAALEERYQELQTAHLELEHTQDSLVRTEKLASVGQLAAGVAHEIGNPLAAILGYTELLREEELPREVSRDVLERMEIQIGRIRAIIRDLLDYSRDDAERGLEAVDVSRCVEEAVHLVSAHPRGRRMRCEVRAEAEMPGVWGSPGGIVQVLLNVLINAADAMEHLEAGEARVEIALLAGDSGPCVQVRDHGAGLDPGVAARIFDPFFTTKAPGVGTGLGLSMSLRLMRRFGGDLCVAPAEGRGSVFTLVFAPAKDGGARRRQDSPERVSGG